MRGTLLLSLLAIAIGGCGDHGLPNPDMGGTGQDMSIADMAELDMGIPDDAKHLVTFSMFAQDFAQTICAHYVACGQLDSAQMSACIENNLRHTGWDQDVEITKGRVEINELQCLDAIKTSRCDFSDVGAWSTRCLQFLYNGFQAAGASCVADVECNNNNFCQHAGSDAGVPEQVTGCPGTCAAPKANGAVCRLSSECGSNSYCDSTNHCAKQSAINQPCNNSFNVGTGPSCQFGLMCPTFSATPTCVVPTMQTSLHGACDPFQGSSTSVPACASGMYCQLQYTATTTTCTAASGCPSIPGGYCNTGTGLCQQPTAGKCENKIASGADCDPNSDGATSFVNDQCADGSLCMQVGTQTKATCQAFGSANAPCAADNQCKVGLYCNANKCTPWFADGQPCDGNTFHCASETQQNVCIVDNPDAGATATCQVTKSFGSSCIPGFEDSLCEPSDFPQSTYCAPNGSGGGTCAPKCF